MQTKVSKKKVSGPPPLRAEGMPPTGECAGCTYPLAYRVVWEVLDEMGLGGNTIIVGGAACGMGIIGSDTDLIFPNHGQNIDVATGLKRLLPDRVVLIFGGDGDVAAIGAGAFINAAARGEKFTLLMLNNGHYAMTGGQMAPTTIMGQETTTTPWGRDATSGYTMTAAELLVPLRGVVYSARCAVISPATFQRTKKYLKAALQKQLGNVGFSFLEILTACPTGWHKKPLESLKWVEEKVIPQLPLGEFKNVDSIL